MTIRIEAATPPYSQQVQETFDRLMPEGLPPLVLFTTLARDERLWGRFNKGALLDKGHVTLRQRELVICRTTALSRSEYEWGVHVSFFAERARLDERMLVSLVHGTADDACWSAEDSVLIRACDQLHASSDIDDALWSALRERFTELALLEVVMLSGFYRTVSCLTNSLRLPLETFAAKFPAKPREHGASIV